MNVPVTDAAFDARQEQSPRGEQPAWYDGRQIPPEAAIMPDRITVIREAERPQVDFVGGATYRAIVGDDTGAGAPIRTGIQTSPPGYQTRVHSHPYVETLTVISGRGEAWLDNEPGRIALEPGVTVVLPPDRAHAFRVVGDQPLVTLGIHASGKRIVNYKEAAAS
jgi:quercetin dioxygenase-like cupin family protein